MIETLIAMLTTLFVGLKLLDLITWSWWLVLAPLWGYILLVVLVLTLVIWVRVVR